VKNAVKSFSTKSRLGKNNHPPKNAPHKPAFPQEEGMFSPNQNKQPGRFRKKPRKPLKKEKVTTHAKPASAPFPVFHSPVPAQNANTRRVEVVRLTTIAPNRPKKPRPGRTEKP
jgi:hypothetical protein